MHDELAAHETFEACAAEQREELLLEGAVEGSDVAHGLVRPS
jgi:hypothetical protein